MKLIVYRDDRRENCTLGHMAVDGEYFCKTLEDKCRDENLNGIFDNNETKVYGETAIPYGTYKVIMHWSPKFGRTLPLLLDVPHFEGVLIHVGNYAKDTYGCILVGEYHSGDMLCNSKVYETKLSERISEAISSGEEVTIEIAIAA